MQRTVEAFSDDAYKRTWEPMGSPHFIGGPMMATGPIVRLKTSPDDAESLFMDAHPRYFTQEDGLAEGWYDASEWGKDYDSMGALYGYVVMIPAVPPR